MSVFSGFFASANPSSSPPPPLTSLKTHKPGRHRHQLSLKRTAARSLPAGQDDEAIYGPPSPRSSPTSLIVRQSSSGNSPITPADRPSDWDHLDGSTDELFLSEHYPPIHSRLYPFFNEKLSSPIGMGRGQPIVAPAHLLPAYVSLAHIWRRIARILASRPYHLTELPDTLSYPADELALASIDQAIAPFNLALPPAVREHFMVHDGQDVFSQTVCPSASAGIVWGLWLMSCEEVAAEWGFWRRLDGGSMPGDAFAATDFAPHARRPSPATSLAHTPTHVDERMSSCPAGWVRETYSHPGWLPLLSDRVGNYIGVDLSPPGCTGPSDDADESIADPGHLLRGGGQGHGRAEVGQVIAFGREIDEKVVLWRGSGRDGWAHWLASFADDLEDGRFARLTGSRRRTSSTRRRTSDGELGWTPSDEEQDEEDEDGLGDLGYFNDGTGTVAADVVDEFKGWRLAGEYRGMSVIEALCARSKKRWAEIGLHSSRIDGPESVHSFGSQPSRTSRGPMDEQPAILVTGPASDVRHRQKQAGGSGSRLDDSVPTTPIAFVTPPSPGPSPELELTDGLPEPSGPTAGPSQPARSTTGLQPRAARGKSRPVRRAPPPAPVSLDLPTMDSLLLDSPRQMRFDKATEAEAKPGGTLVSRLSIVGRRLSEEVGRRSGWGGGVFLNGTAGAGTGAGDVIGMGMIVGEGQKREGVTSANGVGGNGSVGGDGVVGNGNGHGHGGNTSENGGLEIMRTVI